MSLGQKSHHCTVEQVLQAQRESQDLAGAQVPSVEEEVALKALSPSSGNATSSATALVHGSLEEESGVRVPSAPQSLQGAWSSSTAIVAFPIPISAEGASHQVEERANASRSWQKKQLGQKVLHLVRLLLFKYQRKEPTTKTEITALVTHKYRAQFPVVFRRAAEILQLVFEVDVREVGPIGHTYVLVTTLDHSHHRMPSGSALSLQKSSSLILVLGVIFLEGSCAHEEKVWNVLGMMGIYVGREHFIHGEPRRLLTKHWVQEKYLQYRRAPNSFPVHGEFLRGPRAHMGTTQMKVLEVVAKVSGTEPSSFPSSLH
ncbi:PREDICTED: melanoma-associated antigen 10-like [Chrysochloris asiatica]|uniref:Melanoma-associated antigen 10-like n=1 Tax=Chrysochloris asiatica TaxID=185453 RepID=A0A9B0TRZ0_CHRAS|nr:PREDICTED: melanoma-associated antigen 10-like [Chrysochloris asiatica]